MITQTLALLVDAYRELNARKMFWVSLLLSGLCVGAFATLGLGPGGLTVLWFELPVPAPAFWYKTAFSWFVVGMWVSIGAMILALISTASIFPELIASGSIDLYLSKPIGRLRLFLTKYLTGLLFVLLQAAVFAAAAYLVLGLRGGQWRPGLFLLVPLTVLLFSYLFAVCVFAGVLTRSTLAAILITVVFWFLCFVTNKAEQTMFAFRALHAGQARAYDRVAREADAELAELKRNPSVTNLFGVRERRVRERRDDLRRRADAARASGEKLEVAYRVVRGVATVVPKTGETIDLLDRTLFTDKDLREARDAMTGNAGGGGPEFDEDAFEPLAVPAPAVTTAPSTSAAELAAQAAEDERARAQRRAARLEAQEEADRAARSRSVPWILGTSLAFEAVVVALAAWIFARRDY